MFAAVTAAYSGFPADTKHTRQTQTDSKSANPLLPNFAELVKDSTVKTRERMNAENNARAAEDSRLAAEERLFPSIAQKQQEDKPTVECSNEFKN
ncbi:hypothetical protein LTR12_018442 [Friedmanniomyces endolithicus]|nr:hypothetical protein LTR12_018442 [Friedmanniomyces endolithicus]